MKTKEVRNKVESLLKELSNDVYNVDDIKAFFLVKNIAEDWIFEKVTGQKKTHSEECTQGMDSRNKVESLLEEIANSLCKCKGKEKKAFSLLMDVSKEWIASKQCNYV